MIETLRIEDMAVVDAVELEFGPGLNVLTGETGAGKSIVLGALSLLAGSRASSHLIRDGREETAVEAVFDTSRLSDLEASLAFYEKYARMKPPGRVLRARPHRRLPAPSDAIRGVGWQGLSPSLSPDARSVETEQLTSCFHSVPGWRNWQTRQI